MTVEHLIKELKKADKDSVVVFVDIDGGWTNISLAIDKYGFASIIPSENTEK